METERMSRRYAGIDAWEPRDVLDALLESQLAAAAAVRTALPAIEAAALAIVGRLSESSGRLIYVGAGTSGRIALQDGAELMPTFGWPPERLLLLIAGGEAALLRAVEGAEDSPEQAAALIAQHTVGRSDALLAVTASGTTPFTLGCLRAAQGAGALTVGIANNAESPLLAEAAHPILLDTGAEVIAGSTRMKAGTAQKIALNLLSSLVMIRLGHVYDGLMIDVQASNAKLLRRREDMLVYLSGRKRGEVREALHHAHGSVKLAMLLLQGCTLAEAQAALQRAGGQLRTALDAIGAQK
jgi:N-acetylmuramic acid 6-phosphate etherase